jgi:hypothetical protein
MAKEREQNALVAFVKVKVNAKEATEGVAEGEGEHRHTFKHLFLQLQQHSER